MWTTINSTDYTDYIPFDSISFKGVTGDPMGHCEFDFEDVGSQIALSIGQEVVMHDENTPPEPSGSGGVIAGSSTPASNFLSGTVSLTNTTTWFLNGTLSSLISRDVNGAGIHMTFSNSALGSGLLVQKVMPGYIKPGNSYMFSAYMTIATPLVNAHSTIMLQFFDQNSNVLGTAIDQRSSTPGNAQIRIAVQGVAPAGTAFAQVYIGGETTVGGTNSGTIAVGTPQLEPMWFVDRGVTYPTDDCNYAQVACRRMPDDTISRATRVFAGYIEDLQVSYDGTNRRYHVACAPAAKTLDNTNLISGVYTSTYDYVIIENLIVAQFTGLLSHVAPYSKTVGTVVQGLQVDAVTYTDMTFRAILNSLSNQSGYGYYVDPYYQVHYRPEFYDVSSIALSDSPDNVNSFPYYDYLLEFDGTQIKQRCKVVGANPSGPQITDGYGGTGSAKSFGLSRIPANVSAVTVNGVSQSTGILGINTYAQGYAALIDVANLILSFNVAPANGAAVSISYTYQNPVVSTVERIDGITASIIAPTYVTPTFDTLINDSSLGSLTSTNQRGLAEINRYGLPLTIIQCKSQQYIPSGYVVYFTSSLDNITNQPFVVQSVDGKCLGNGINEYSYTLGTYIPTMIDHSRNTVSAINRNTSIGNVTTNLQTDIMLAETMSYSWTITLTPITANPGVYGTAIYGTTTYS